MKDVARARVGLLFLASPALVVLALGLDARARRASSAGSEGALRAVIARLPSSDLALSGGARWLRMPSLEEPGAAFADGPALRDPDPAGAAIAPPTSLWGWEP